MGDMFLIMKLNLKHSQVLGALYDLYFTGYNYITAFL
jgi:hypothetical protein